jgi:hypothetical protein
MAFQIHAAPYCRRSLQLSLHRREEDEMREMKGRNRREKEIKKNERKEKK